MSQRVPTCHHCSQKTGDKQKSAEPFFNRFSGAGPQTKKETPFFQPRPAVKQQSDVCQKKEKEITPVKEDGGVQKMIQRAVVWKNITDVPPDLLLILDVDDGDFVGGCVKQIVPHGGIKLIQKGVGEVFNIHFGVFTNPLGQACSFFYESVSGTCLTECYDNMDEAVKKALEWIKQKINEFLDALASVAKAIITVLEFAIMAAILAMMAIILALVAAAA